MALVVKRKPFTSFPDLWDDGFVKDFFDFPKHVGRNPTVAPKANIKETDQDFQIELAIPGYAKEDISIDVEDGVLSVKAHKEEQSEEPGTYTRKEFALSQYERSFRLPIEKIDLDGITAKLEHGILLLVVPKRKEVIEAKTPKSIDIG